MAATGKTPILLYGSTTATNAPVAGNLTNSSDGCEIAINVADKNLFFKDSTNTVNTVPIRQSSASSNGWLSSTDWNTFNNKTSNTGTVTSVSGAGTVSGLSLSGTVTTSGNITLGGTLAVTPSNFASQTANTFLAAPNGTAGAPTFRAIVAADIPTLNQNTTGSAATLTTTRTLWGQNFNGSANVTGALSSVSTLSMSGQLTNTVATGTAPFVVSSTTQVANLNAATAGTATNQSGGTVSATSISDSGNLTFTGTGNRITGDLSNATLANRVMFQSSTTNGNSIIGVLPNGTSTTSSLSLESSSSLTAGSPKGTISCNGTEFNVAASAIAGGTTTYVPLTFTTGGLERARIDTSGNVGIGTTSIPSAVKIQVSGTNNANSTNYANLQVFSTDTATINMGGTIGLGGNFNSTTSSTAFASIRGAKENSTANDYAGYLQFNTVANAGTLTERMRINSSGNLGLGLTPSAWNTVVKVLEVGSVGSALTVNPSVGSVTIRANSLNGSTITYGLNGYGLNYAMNVGSGTHEWKIAPSGTAGSSQSLATVMLLDANGYLLVGYGSSNGAYKLQVNSQIFATSSTIATSDGRYKENITPLSNCLADVCALNPVQFNWKKHPTHNFDTETPTVGFIAQEVQQVLAERPYLNSIVKRNECDVVPAVLDKNENVIEEAVREEFLGIAEGNMIALLTKAIQELKAELDATKAEVAALKRTA